MKVSVLIRKIRKLGLRMGFMKMIGYEAVFSCAFRRFGTDEVYSYLPNTDDFWYADPLIYARDGRQIVYMERVNRHTGLGCIACSDITDGSWGDIIPVIEEPFHMSFPMCFEWDGELYMIPETEMDQHINLYRCREYPYNWERVACFMDGHRLVDIVVTDRSLSGDEITFLGSEYKPGDDFYTRFRRFRLRRGPNGEITCEDLGLVSEGYTLYSRMAGYPMCDHDSAGHMVYPLQRSTSGIYGYSVMFYEDEPGLGEPVREMLPGSIRMDTPRKLIGVHTYSRSDLYEVIDVQYLVRRIRRRN